ncbi:alpha/beta-hydrolase, partial [Periconia macrospinosa]
FGNAGQPIYSGAPFAALQNVIPVSINFGFPISPFATNITERNLAFLDQRAALDWVFGGDLSRVTIFGQSAGGYGVDIWLTGVWPNDEVPFHAAIMQSGT